MALSKPRNARYSDTVPARVDDLCRWVVRYLERKVDDRPSQLSTVLGAATVLLRTNPKTGLMAEPSEEEKELAAYILNAAADQGYGKAIEVVAALIGAADGIALAYVQER